MDIGLKIGIRCARRQNDAAYQHYRRRSIGVTWSTNALGDMFITLWIARLPLSHGPIVLRSRKRGRKRPSRTSFMGNGMWCACRNPKSSDGCVHVEPRFSSQIWSFRLQIWTKGVLVEHRAPLYLGDATFPVSF